MASPAQSVIEQVRIRTVPDPDSPLARFHATRPGPDQGAGTGSVSSSPWIRRFDWILETGSGGEADGSGRLVLAMQRETPRTVYARAEHVAAVVEQLLPALHHPVLLYVGGATPLSEIAAEVQAAKWHPMVAALFCEHRDVGIDGIGSMPVGLDAADLLAGDGARILEELASTLRPTAKENVVLLPNDAMLRSYGVADADSSIELGPDVLARRASVGDSAVERWRELRGCRFLLVPRRIHRDTPAPLEALYLGTVPLLEKGPLAEAYRDLPVVAVADTSAITGEQLERWWQELGPAVQAGRWTSPAFWWQRLTASLPRRRRAFLVIGPESHGNHLLTDLLVRAGCHGGSGDHVPWSQDWRPGLRDDQPWDRSLPTDEDPIVWRRSVPHLRHLPDLAGMVEKLERRGYEVQALVLHRERHAAVQSQLKWHHVADAATAHENIEQAYAHIFEHLRTARIHFTMVGYEMLVHDPEARGQLLSQLGLRAADASLEVWDGNRKWYGPAAADGRRRQPATPDPHPAVGPPASPLADFPEGWFPCPVETWSAFESRVDAGRARMRRLRAVFCGLARDVAKELPNTRARIERAGAMFAEHRVVVFENDSQDGTLELLRAWSREDPRVTVLSERLEAHRWGSTRDAERMRHLARCRNRYLDFVREKLADWDTVIVLDTDLRKGFSYQGLAHTFGADDWHVVGSNGLLVPPVGRPALPPMFFDAWAFRRKGESQPAPVAEVNRLRFTRGEPLLEVDSCFGGLAAYSMAAIRSGTSYGGDDCEHVVFHRALRERGFDRQFLNPSQIVLYAGEATSSS